MKIIQVRPHTVTVRVKQRPAGPPEPVTNMAASSSFLLATTWTSLATTYSFWNLSITIILPVVILSTFLIPSPSRTKV